MKPALVRTLVPAAFALGALISLAAEARADDTKAVGRPPRAVAACTSKSEGAACTLEHTGAHGGTFTGTCAADRRSATLACRPAPPRPRG